MDRVNSMAGLREDAPLTGRAIKNARASGEAMLRDDNGSRDKTGSRDNISGFEAVLAQGLAVLPTPIVLADRATTEGGNVRVNEPAHATAIAPETARKSETTQISNPAVAPQIATSGGATANGDAVAVNVQSDVSASLALVNAHLTDAKLTGQQPTGAPTSGQPVAGALAQANPAATSGDALNVQTLLTQSNTVGVETKIGPQTGIVAQTAPQAQATQAVANAAAAGGRPATPSSTGAAGQDGALEESVTSTQSVSPNDNSASPSPVAANDPGATQALLTANLSDTVGVDVKVASASGIAQSPPDARAGITPTSVAETAHATTDSVPRETQFTPQTIPMLAATLVRRLESGARQFTMRLDPPELGQVEVKLTVTADKKVRAVVSADRPEALADLVRSARELTRALLEAGLDLDERGLTFTLNDPSDSRQGNRRDQHHANNDRLTSVVGAPETDVDAPARAAQATSSNDPFQRWQRARIALTA